MLVGLLEINPPDMEHILQLYSAEIRFDQLGVQLGPGKPMRFNELLTKLRLGEIANLEGVRFAYP